jgi:hypothetical protein
VLKSVEVLLKTAQVLEENDYFLRKNTKTAKNTVFAPKKSDFEQPTNLKTLFKAKYQGSLPTPSTPEN